MSKDVIAIEETDGEGNLIRTLFHGLVQQLSIRSSQGIYYLELEAVSHSILLDTKRRTRSFQNANLACSELIRTVVDASARSRRMEYLQNMEQKKIKVDNEVAKLQSEGMSIEEIAKMKVEQRNFDRMQSYIDSNNYEGLAAMKERNIQ
ncbi:MAG TPA: hypothetical protein VGI33_19100 [Paenibacillus sp.]